MYFSFQEYCEEVLLEEICDNEHYPVYIDVYKQLLDEIRKWALESFGVDALRHCAYEAAPKLDPEHYRAISRTVYVLEKGYFGEAV